MSNTFTIANDYDPDGDMSPNADPVEEYLTYKSHVARERSATRAFRW
jgi:hypothetical protein